MPRKFYNIQPARSPRSGHCPQQKVQKDKRNVQRFIFDFAPASDYFARSDSIIGRQRTSAATGYLFSCLGEKMKVRMLALLGLALLATNGAVQGAPVTLLSEDFESLTVGDLLGQASWTGQDPVNAAADDGFKYAVSASGNIAGIQSLLVDGGGASSATNERYDTMAKSFLFTPDSMNATDLQLKFKVGTTSASTTANTFFGIGLSSSTTAINIAGARRLGNTDAFEARVGTDSSVGSPNVDTLGAKNFDFNGDTVFDAYEATSDANEWQDSAMDLVFDVEITARYVPGGNDKIRILIDGLDAFVKNSTASGGSGIITNLLSPDSDGFYDFGGEFATGTLYTVIYNNSGATGNLRVDDILVTSNVVPEPSTLVLGALGGFGLLSFCWRSRRG